MAEVIRGRQAIVAASNRPIEVRFETVTGQSVELVLQRPNAADRAELMEFIDRKGKAAPSMREVAIRALHACLGPDDRGSLAETEDLLWSAVGGASGPLADSVLRLFGMDAGKAEGAPDPVPFSSPPR